MTANYYEIRVEGHLDDAWRDWFGGLAIRREPGGESVLCGAVVDQAALHAVLERVRDLNLTLLAVQRRETAPEHSPQ